MHVRERKYNLVHSLFHCKVLRLYEEGDKNWCCSPLLDNSTAKCSASLFLFSFLHTPKGKRQLNKTNGIRGRRMFTLSAGRSGRIRGKQSPPPDSSHMASRPSTQLFTVLAESQSSVNLLLLLLPLLLHRP